MKKPIHSLYTDRAKIGLHLCLLGSLMAIGGCASLPFIHQNTTLPSVQAELMVEPSNNQPGTYTVIGKTDFPDRSALRVAAVRYLYPTNPASQVLGSKPTYSILAYATTTVEKGNWTVPLTVWQIAPTGQYQESWQLNQPDLKLQLKPAENLVFIATLGPGIKADALQQLEQSLLKDQKGLNSSMIGRSGNDRFLQLIQIVDAKLPTGSTQPPTPDPNDLNDGWGNRFLMPDEPPNPNNLEFPQDRRTNAKPNPREFMR
jgi:hypothetical protein